MSCSLSWRKPFLLICFVLMGCASADPAGYPLPAMSFDHLEPFPVAVASVQVGQPNEVPGHAAHIERFIVPPDEAVNAYLVRRFVPHGLNNKLKIDIEEAGVFHIRTPSSHQVTRFFGVDRTEEYNLVIKLNVILMDDLGYEKQSKMIKGTRRIRVSEHASLVELEKKQFKGLESLLADIDGAVIRTVRDDFGL